MKHALFGIDTAINDKELVSLFHKFITPAESDKINDLLKGKNVEVQTLIDIFGHFGVFERPNRDNILRLCRKVFTLTSKVALF